MEFFKYHSLGNDYILLDALQAPLRLSPADIQMLCHRHLGIGGDGIIVIEPSERAMCRMINFNPDASQADVSGNGLRCLAKHLFDSGIQAEEEMLVDTPSGVKKLKIHTTLGKVSTVEVYMGSPDFRRSSIPMQGEGEEAVEISVAAAGKTVSATCLSIGNPHCVLFLDNLEDALVRELGPAIENHPLFPLRVNVEFVQVIDVSEMRLRSWERGAGETMASATGAAAAVAAALRTRRCKRKIHVQLPGGLMEVEVAPDGNIVTRGPARRVFRGELDEDWRERSRIIVA
ncbi:MAG: diaminopimelate epimerase [Actinobacteria bacterium]|nr:diaminopimelate epimerase [Actinomycetota bacterium]